MRNFLDSIVDRDVARYGRLVGYACYAKRSLMSGMLPHQESRRSCDDKTLVRRGFSIRLLILAAIYAETQFRLHFPVFTLPLLCKSRDGVPGLVK